MILGAVLTSGIFPAPALARVEVNVDRVGWPLMRLGDAVRTGTWTPVVVTVSLLDQPTFDGTLRVRQLDADGDAAYDAVEVHLRNESGSAQRYELYMFAQPRRGEARFSVELYDQDGKAEQFVSQGVLTMRATPAQQPAIVDDNDVVVLSVSREAIGRVRDFVDPDKSRFFDQAPFIGHVSPQEMPDLWIGLEAVDCIVWDDARPEDLSDRQLLALIEWIRQGGTLLIAASRTAGSLVLSDRLAEILPADIGDVVVVDNLPDVRLQLVGAPRLGEQAVDPGEWYNNPFPRPIPVVRCTVRSGAFVVAAESGSAALEGQRLVQSDVLTERELGRGRIVLSAVALSDLFSGEGEPIDFFARIFQFRELGSSDEVHPATASLFDRVAGYVSFATRASAYLLLAGMASAAYVLAATFGSWTLLLRRGWQRHSWTVFAMVAVAASVLAIVVVNGMRGFGERLHQVTVVDANADGGRAFATVLFGLKTSTDKRVDVWLPSDVLGAREPERTDCFLRPMPATGDPLATLSRFADPDEYRVLPASASMEDVRIRATLKQFEGRWTGFLPGKVGGNVTIQRGQITPDSYIVNQLGVDLSQCLLLQARVPPNRTRAIRDTMIQVFEIGDLPSGPQQVSLSERAYRPKPTETLRAFLRRSMLHDYHAEWSRSFTGLLGGMGSAARGARPFLVGEERKALLLLSTVGEFDPVHFKGALDWGGTATISRDRLRWLDLSDRLDVDSVYLIGFADDPGPARLFMREGRRPYRPVGPDPRKTLTAYRIRIPVNNLGTGPLPEEDKSDEDVDSLIDRLSGKPAESKP